MSKSKIKLVREEVDDILELITAFHDANTFGISTKRYAGIGIIMKVKIPTIVNGILGHFTVEITGVADW